MLGNAILCNTKPLELESEGVILPQKDSYGEIRVKNIKDTTERTETSRQQEPFQWQ